jgi:hypothetical protein
MTTQDDNDRKKPEERFVERLTNETREHYNAPPEPPRDEMWAVIQAARAARADEARVFPMRRFRPQPWWIGVAAALLVGIAIGRFTLSRVGSEGPQVADQGPAPEAMAALNGGRPALDGSEAASPYMFVAAEHLARTESFLTMFRADRKRDELDDEVRTWARSLLTRTRLLQNSPAASDASMARLLEDLELILVQIVQLRPGDAEDAGLIEEGLQDRQLLFRLRTASAAGLTAGT